MSVRDNAPRAFAWLALLALAACAPAPVRQAGDAALLAAQAAREAGIAAETDWRLSGRLVVSAGGEGGSGRIQWRQRGGDFEITLTAPVTRQGWRLVQAGGQARLEGLDGGPRTGPDAAALLFEATGWRIPVAALADWARGARAPGPAELAFGADGRPSLLVQQGWTVEYRDWAEGEPLRPRRVFARQGEASVRLVVEAWERP